MSVVTVTGQKSQPQGLSEGTEMNPWDQSSPEAATLSPEQNLPSNEDESLLL